MQAREADCNMASAAGPASPAGPDPPQPDGSSPPSDGTIRPAPVIHVCVLGSRHPLADTSAGWDDPPPSLSDPDLTIVDLTTLTRDALERADKENLDEAQRSIRDKWHGHGTVVVITQPWFRIDMEGRAYSNYHVSPVELVTRSVAKGRRVAWGSGKIIDAYKDNVGHFSFYIEKYGRIERPALASPKDLEPYIVPNSKIADHTGHLLGGALNLRQKLRGMYKPIKMGRLLFLPPPTGPVEDAIGAIIFAYKGASSDAEPPPGWASKMALPESNRLGAEIKELAQTVRGIQDKISNLKSAKAAIDAHLRLLYSKGADLEDAVCRAFKVLGFDEVKRGRDRRKEDWVLDASTNGYSRAAIEVKGADERTGKHGLLQCSGWVDELFGLDGKQTKGVFIPNQHRLEKYPGSRAERVRIEAELQEYAHTRGICIIPACVLFEAVKKVLGGEAPDREEIEARITRTSGVLEDVLGGGGD